jgi:integrase
MVSNKSLLSPRKHSRGPPPTKKQPPLGATAQHQSVRHGWSHHCLPLMGDDTPLTAVLERYLSQREACPNYRRHLWRTVERLSSFGITSVANMNPESVNRWLDSLACSKQTRANYRRQACTIVRAALGPDAAHFINGVRRVKAPLPPPVAWTRDELSRLLHHARNLHGNLQCGCPAALFFTGWLMLGYSSGLRFSDLLSLRCHQIRDGRLYAVQHKTGESIVHVLPSECAEILTQLSVLSQDGTMFKWALSERWLRIRWGRLVKGAGLTGTCKWMRRTGATWVEATQPGMASRWLGHRSPELAMKHYVDRSLIPNTCPAPPPIAG